MISLCNLSAALENLRLSQADLMDMRTDAAHWPSVSMHAKPSVMTAEPVHTNGIAEQPKFFTDADVKNRSRGCLPSIRTQLTQTPTDPSLLSGIIRSGSKSAIVAEPNLTHRNTVIFDGDCGQAVQGVSKAIIETLDGDGAARRGSVWESPLSIINAVDVMGGLLGGVFGILLSPFTSALQESIKRAQILPRLIHVCAGICQSYRNT
ncbi:hypothetical protein BJ170DRAFT_404964 [Xylariales sp. AK1849]|nr:hypothetical protein BJ170DRAFT_404964 [Xylariales sp. AK1849]